MKHKLKITIVGGGSTWTPGILNAFIRHMDTLPVTELVLYDINEERQAPIGEYAQLLFRLHAPKVKVIYTRTKTLLMTPWILSWFRSVQADITCGKRMKRFLWNTECWVRKPAAPVDLPMGFVL